jgi:hypothetical protein
MNERFITLDPKESSPICFEIGCGRLMRRYDPMRKLYACDCGGRATKFQALEGGVWGFPQADGHDADTFSAAELVTPAGVGVGLRAVADGLLLKADEPHVVEGRP